MNTFHTCSPGVDILRNAVNTLVNIQATTEKWDCEDQPGDVDIQRCSGAFR